MANAVGMISVWVKGGGKHSANDPQSNPNHTVKRLSDLRELLREQYLLDV
jgi:FMN phosphatase YigB (HAD superfamily)